MVMENLTAFVKSTRLVNLAAGAPTKPADLVEFEKQLQMGAKTDHASVGVTLPRTDHASVGVLLPRPPPPEAPPKADPATEAKAGGTPASAPVGDLKQATKGKNIFAFGSVAL